MPEPRLAALWPAALLATLVAFGLAAHFLDLFEWRDALVWARGYAQHWWLAPALIVLQVLLFMFALPGGRCGGATGKSMFAVAQRNRECIVSGAAVRGSLVHWGRVEKSS